MGMGQIELFPEAAPLPGGFVYRADFISPAEEKMLLAEVEVLEFGHTQFHGVAAKRRVAHFGSSYNFDGGRLGSAPPMPEFLLPLRERVATFAGCSGKEFAEALVTDYPVGAPIGWHRDAPPFELIAGVSLLSACTMRFRPWPVVKGGERVKPLVQVLEPRSVYLLRGASRTAWQHQIPPAAQRRVSITFRTLRA